LTAAIEEESKMKTTVTVLAAAALAALAGLPAQANDSAVCSGVGIQGRAAAKSVPYTLKGGEMVNVTCPGPWVLANLPAGNYKVTATFNGKSETRSVTVSAKGQRQQEFIFSPSAS
jgi:glucose/arabinose dehydrogenase